MSDSLKNLQKAEELEFCRTVPFPRSTDNQWRCENTSCRALLGLADPETKSQIHIFKGGTPPASDITIFDAGGVVIRQTCRQCGEENWLSTIGIDRPA